MFPRLLRLCAFAALLPAVASAQNISLGDTLAKWGYGRDTIKARDLGRWSLQNFSVAAEKNKRFVELGGVRVYIGQPIIEEEGRFHIAKRDFDKALSPILAPKAAGLPAVRTIVLDAGHGGKDPGKQNLSLALNEKAVALDVVRRLKFLLETKGYRVLLTRARDSYIELEDRADFANRQRADLFISVHFNAGPAAVSGLETYCLTPAGQHSTNDAGAAGDTREEYGNRNDAWNILLAYYAQKSLVEKLDAEDRGVRRARFAVLRDIACPGMLIECGFLSNSTEAAKIGTPVYREKIAQGISDAVTHYHNRIIKLAAKTAPKTDGAAATKTGGTAAKAAK